MSRGVTAVFPDRFAPRRPGAPAPRLGGGRLRHLTCTRALGQHAQELAARGDVELAEHLAQVLGDRVLADEQPRADLGVREPIAGELRDLPLPAGEIVACLDGALARRLARRS